MKRLACSLLLALSACAHVDPMPADPLAHAARLMAGHFDSTRQAARTPGYLPVLLTMQPIWAGRDDGRWFYVEQAMADSAGQPYRQRVYRLRLGDGGDVVSEVFVLAEPERFVRGWETGAIDGLTEQDLEPREGCAVYLRPAAGGFRGATRGRGCVSSLRGASWASAEVELAGDGLRSWDRGFDAGGRQVWGATAGPYEFRRID